MNGVRKNSGDLEGSISTLILTEIAEDSRTVFFVLWPHPRHVWVKDRTRATQATAVTTQDT